MKKKIISLIASFLFLSTSYLMAVPDISDVIYIKAHSAHSNEDIFEFHNGEISLIDDEKTKHSEIVIPETINGEKVTAIGFYSFSDCTELTSITIPDSVTKMGDSVFL